MTNESETIKVEQRHFEALDNAIRILVKAIDKNRNSAALTELPALLRTIQARIDRQHYLIDCITRVPGFNDLIDAQAINLPWLGCLADWRCTDATTPPKAPAELVAKGIDSYSPSEAYQKGREDGRAEIQEAVDSSAPDNFESVLNGYAVIKKSTVSMRAVEEGRRSLSECRQRSFNDTATVQAVFFAMLYVADCAIERVALLKAKAPAVGLSDEDILCLGKSHCYTHSKGTFVGERFVFEPQHLQTFAHAIESAVAGSGEKPHLYNSDPDHGEGL